MLLNRQRTLLTIVASIAFASALLVTALAAREVRLKTAQISMAEETIRAVTNFRYLTMEVVLYREPRAARQWAERYETVKAALDAHQYSGRAANLLLERERANLAVLDRLFARLSASGAVEGRGGPEVPMARSNTIVSALFLTTQDMLDDGFDLMRMIRIDLEEAQRLATIGTIASLALLMLLIAFTSIVMKRQVLEPVAALQRLTEQVIEGQLDVRLNLLAPNEIGLLGRTFDNMTQQLQHSHQAERESRQVLADARDEAQQASRAKSQFLANMSHEIRTPMNAVLGMLELLQHTELSAAQADYARKSESAARALLELLNDILDFSQVEANKLELEHSPFRLDDLLRDLSVILSSLLGEKEVELVFAVDPAVPPQLVGDATRLRQVLLNLASNAIKFTERGDITLALRVLHRDAQHCTLELSVQDSGIGIAEDKLASIFDGFTQAEASTSRRFGGTGLGLTISQRLVGLMGGELTVRSTLGEGSRFAFTVTMAVAPGGGTAPAPAGPVRHVLVVDDNAAARASLVGMLAAAGWQGTAAASAEHALALLVTSSAGQPFDAVLLDWRMPGLDGWELAQQLRQHAEPLVQIMMVTAHGRAALAERLRREPDLLDGFLAKPVTPAMLREAVSGAGATRAPAASAQATPRHLLRLDGLRLLVVDDNAMNQQIARELLTREGAQVDVAGGGQAALQIAAAASYDAILMDIQMPDMDGYACTRALRASEAHRKTPVIAMTANVMLSDREACLAAGMNEHVGKPIAIDTMVAVLLRLCRQASPQPEGRLADDASSLGADGMPSLPVAGTLDVAEAIARLGGDPALYVALAHTYGTEAAQFMPSLQAALANLDLPAAANVLHTFKSAAGIIGASALQAASGELEAQLRSGTAGAGIAGALDQLQALVDDSHVQLAQAVKSLTAGAPAARGGAEPLADLLRELQKQLGERNMAALATLRHIEQGHAAALGAGLPVLAEAVGKLDFARALPLCTILIGELP